MAKLEKRNLTFMPQRGRLDARRPGQASDGVPVLWGLFCTQGNTWKQLLVIENGTTIIDIERAIAEHISESHPETKEH